MSARAFFAPGWALLGSAPRTLAILWNQQRCSLVWGNTSRSAPQNPSAPSPIARIGARMPRRLQSRSRSAQDWSGLPVAVGQGDEFLATVGPHTDHDQQTQLVLLQADVDMVGVDPGRGAGVPISPSPRAALRTGRAPRRRIRLSTSPAGVRDVLMRCSATARGSSCPGSGSGLSAPRRG